MKYGDMIPIPHPSPIRRTKAGLAAPAPAPRVCVLTRAGAMGRANRRSRPAMKSALPSERLGGLRHAQRRKRCFVVRTRAQQLRKPHRTKSAPTADSRRPTRRRCPRGGRAHSTKPNPAVAPRAARTGLRLTCARPHAGARRPWRPRRSGDGEYVSCPRILSPYSRC
jgi:hypothetical protein